MNLRIFHVATRWKVFWEVLPVSIQTSPWYFGLRLKPWTYTCQNRFWFPASKKALEFPLVPCIQLCNWKNGLNGPQLLTEKLFYTNSSPQNAMRLWFFFWKWTRTPNEELFLYGDSFGEHYQQRTKSLHFERTFRTAYFAWTVRTPVTRKNPGKLFQDSRRG